jgi:mono/diheme cytochrome c family protein
MRLTVLAFAAALLALPQAAGAGDPTTGRQIAQRWCASCHSMEGAQMGTDNAPPFAQIAKKPGRTPETIRTWLSAPHPPMPDLSLSRVDIDDLVAYLDQLGRQ